jgi:hypothetical protein
MKRPIDTSQPSELVDLLEREGGGLVEIVGSGEWELRFGIGRGR